VASTTCRPVPVWSVHQNRFQRDFAPKSTHPERTNGRPGFWLLARLLTGPADAILSLSATSSKRIAELWKLRASTKAGRMDHKFPIPSAIQRPPAKIKRATSKPALHPAAPVCLAAARPRYALSRLANSGTRCFTLRWLSLV
jgi:hypothetical protein